MVSKGVLRVERIHVRLTELELHALRRMSRQEGVSVAHIIRRGVDDQVLRASASDRLAHLERLRERVASFRSNLDDLSTEHDRHLQAAYDQPDDMRGHVGNPGTAGDNTARSSP